MKIQYIVCRKCGHAKKEKIYDAEDAERLKIQLVRPSCEKCGSKDVELRD